jgi:hypothetical protein
MEEAMRDARKLFASVPAGRGYDERLMFAVQSALSEVHDEAIEAAANCAANFCKEWQPYTKADIAKSIRALKKNADNGEETQRAELASRIK